MNQCIHCRLSIPGTRLIVLLQNVGILGKRTRYVVVNNTEEGTKQPGP